ncbi:MAG TPA: 30S ribosome-binding factor RbfA [Planctomycetes bacterium]|nr:30S ribosome-binding factor RbfA [Planctomycetota bacterium]|tara:strand:- start:1815 stop:2192 length:378 start_codon:yes stop_codon:yes gene_type:complete
MATERRRKQIARRIQEKLARILISEMKDPRASFVTITGVEVNEDLAVAKISWSAIEAKHRSKVDHMLEHARGFLRTEVARDLNLRTAPRLDFEYDEGLERTERIETILRGVLPKQLPEGDENTKE